MPASYQVGNPLRLKVQLDPVEAIRKYKKDSASAGMPNTSMQNQSLFSYLSQKMNNIGTIRNCACPQNLWPHK